MEEVREVSVVGVSDPKYGEVVCAWVVGRSGVERGVDDAGVGSEDPMTWEEYDERRRRGDAFVNVNIDANTDSVGSMVRTGGTAKEEEEGSGGKLKLTKEKVQRHVRAHLSGHLVPTVCFLDRRVPEDGEWEDSEV
ncbi:hypothetical protein EYC84_008340 [Monilinia fructicola]|uniref:AMP-binding enzyme C-terminal domain-containing protein n=1 Tax=Monilinia fructicola TaxID=38448 RepID=A0A5M9JEU0_MONFR|nr:hypothetical protein EYC84_008340 [Monilinia fructicola]